MASVVLASRGSIVGRALFDLVEHEGGKRQGLPFEPKAELLVDGILEGDSGDGGNGSIAG